MENPIKTVLWAVNSEHFSMFDRKIFGVHILREEGITDVFGAYTIDVSYPDTSKCFPVIYLEADNYEDQYIIGDNSLIARNRTFTTDRTFEELNKLNSIELAEWIDKFFEEIRGRNNLSRFNSQQTVFSK
jgi:hypothetical protein